LTRGEAVTRAFNTRFSEIKAFKVSDAMHTASLAATAGPATGSVDRVGKDMIIGQIESSAQNRDARLTT
jgi:hypothetical protein